MAKIWPFMEKQGPHMVLKIGSSLILIIVLRDVQCQISHCWVYPVIPFLRNGQTVPFYGQKMVPTLSFKLVLPES